ncbi:hypothetical protein GL58_10735 [Comamonas testosteroni]|uniref:Uncharacterized protein n=1 Tax=Comamonas testosteroni TaxID=285 RepID=A0A0L7MGZ9_COMTE|nr:hypothetical protein [Comamonas testosteroni]KOC21161.1 hypothetical protein GL58_10735 [Comamonas testosteroni]
MKVEVGTITILRISEVPRLDPIRVTLDDIGPGQGRINIESYGKAWASYWGAMGKESIAQFFITCDNHYLIKNLAPELRGGKFCGHTLEKDARKKVLAQRQKRLLTNDEARDLYERAGDLHLCETLNECWHADTELLQELYGQDEWWYPVGDAASIDNPEYLGLARICDAVREALKSQAAAKEGAQQG